MSTVRDEYTNIVGVDTHARTNTYAILAAATGQVMDTATFPTSPPGLKRAIAWIDRRSDPGKTLVAIEGANSYGSGLTRALRATALDICEVRPPRRTSRAGRGKSTALTHLLLLARCSGNRSQPCWIPVPKETGRLYESFSTPATLWNAKAPRTV